MYQFQETYQFQRVDVGLILPRQIENVFSSGRTIALTFGAQCTSLVMHSYSSVDSRKTPNLPKALRTQKVPKGSHSCADADHFTYHPVVLLGNGESNSYMHLQMMFSSNFYLLSPLPSFDNYISDLFGQFLAINRVLKLSSSPPAR